MLTEIVLPLTTRSPPIMALPVVVNVSACTCPAVLILPPVIFAVTVRLPNVPTLVRLLLTTLELRVSPVSAPAATPEAVTPVS